MDTPKFIQNLNFVTYPHERVAVPSKLRFTEVDISEMPYNVDYLTRYRAEAIFRINFIVNNNYMFAGSPEVPSILRKQLLLEIYGEVAHALKELCYEAYDFDQMHHSDFVKKLEEISKQILGEE